MVVMKLFKSSILFFIVLLVFTGCDKNAKNGGLDAMRFGENLTIIITADETVDADHLEKVLDGTIKKDVPYFDLWDETELTKLINYLEENAYYIKEGTYTFNQAWGFEDGKFVLNNGERREVFKYQKK